ncbi:hypoxanthine phosphoribosyltransferase [Candidatus Gracilibacteria bacterium]|nr:hypoxanthine phosphoribosyltransferase [Candidatus Gracilibacteria bacterium]
MAAENNHKDIIEKILLSNEQIDKRITELAKAISEDYKNRDLILICILKGGLYFLIDLSKKLTIPHTFDVVGAASYGKSTKSSGHVVITKDVTTDIRNKDIIIIEDIYDTGTTLKVVCDLLNVHNPKSISVCALIVKNKKHIKEIPIKYEGFEIKDEFVVGYGLDYDEKYRHFNFIGILRKELYS